MTGRFTPVRAPVFALVLALATPAAARPPAELRVWLEPEGQVVVGQQVRVRVEVLTPSWFTRAPRLPELTLEGAVSLRPERFGSNFTARRGAETWAGQRRTYLVFPQRSGVLRLPPLEIELGVATGDGPSEPFTLRSEPLRLAVVLPPELAGRDDVVTARRVTLRESWDRPLDGLAVGDAPRRTVRVSADASLGMLLPPVGLAAPDGIAVYPEAPRIEDRTDRGRSGGERIEAATYVLQREGAFLLPAIEVHWWDPARGALVTETLAERTLEVGPGDPAVAAAPSLFARAARVLRDLAPLGHFVREHWLALLLAGAIGYFAVPSLHHHARGAVERLRHARARRLDSEAHHFRRLLRSIRRGDPDAIVRAHWQWRDRLAAVVRPGSFRSAAEASGFAALWARLERARYGGGQGAPEPSELRAGLRALHSALRAAERDAVRSSWASLNPRGRRAAP